MLNIQPTILHATYDAMRAGSYLFADVFPHDTPCILVVTPDNRSGFDYLRDISPGGMEYEEYMSRLAREDQGWYRLYRLAADEGRYRKLVTS